MKKSSSLFRLAERFHYKYAGISAEDARTQVEDAIWTALHNASGNKSVGIMPFVQMAKQDGIVISFDVTRTDHFSGPPTITVSNLKIGEGGWHHNDKYQPLTDQIKNYLEKYPELFPTQRSGMDVNYNNFTIHLQFPTQFGTGVAQQ
jgi:hypothetical protein